MKLNDSTQPFERPAWMADELVRSIEPKKLDFLHKIFCEGKGKSQREMMAFLIPTMKMAKKEGLTLTPQEMQAAISAIKKYSTEEELKQIDKLLTQQHKG